MSWYWGGKVSWYWGGKVSWYWGGKVSWYWGGKVSWNWGGQVSWYWGGNVSWYWGGETCHFLLIIQIMTFEIECLINSYSTIETSPMHNGWGLPPNVKVTYIRSEIK